MKRRLDLYLYEQGFFESRSIARAMVMAGLVSVDGRTDLKPGVHVDGSERIEMLRTPEYVSRGGRKLAHALDAFGVGVGGRVVLDVGASTGGFTDCLIQRGAAVVIALDVGKGQLHWRLRCDSRVRPLEGKNVRYLKPEDLPDEPSLATIDVSFISLEKVVGPVFGVLPPDGEAVALVKPQFEAGRGSVGRGGVVREPGVHLSVLRAAKEWVEELGLGLLGVTASPMTGPKGNVEFFIHVANGLHSVVSDEDIAAEVGRIHRADRG